MEDRKKTQLMKKLIQTLILGLLLVLLVVLFISGHYMLSSFILLGLSFIPFLQRFEKKTVTSREIVILAILAAIAAISRVPFAAIPSVQPSTFVVIISGVVFGPQSGFVIGTMTALVSNLFLGQGPWTPWQMFAWGMIGFFAGLLSNSWIMKTNIGRVLFGASSGILYGWVLNIWVVLSISKGLHISEILLIYGSSFLFDLLHALTNVVLLLVFSNSWIKILTRFKKKYGLLH